MWETKQYKEPKGLCGKHGPRRSFPLSTKYTEATEILLFLCGGEDGRTCFAQSCRKCFFFFFLKKKHDLDMPGMDEGFDFMRGGGTQLNSSHEVPK
jgi:hypothetical protein